MRIGKLAELVGISTRAVRHYHRVGLLPEPARRANGYREYSLRDAVELARIRRLVEVGLSLAEVADVLAGDADRDLTEILRELDAALAGQEAEHPPAPGPAGPVAGPGRSRYARRSGAGLARADRALRPDGRGRRRAARAGAGHGGQRP